MTTTMQDFIAEVEQFLAPVPLRERKAHRFAWGEGSDDVAIFEEADPELEREQLDNVRKWRRTLAAAGLSWITGPKELGGRGLPKEFQVAFDRMVGRHQTPPSGPVLISLGMVAPTILAHGTDVAKRRYLASMHSGDTVGCQLFSEPGAGSDLAGVSMSAIRDGDGWRLTGQKVWSSGAHLAEIGQILCRTSDGPRHRNLTAFILDMSAPGVEVRPLRQMTGGAAFNEVFVDGAFVPDDHRLGEVDRGWDVAVTALTNERGAMGGGGFGGKGLMSIDRLIAVVRHAERSTDPVARQQLAALICGLRTASWTRQRFADTKTSGASGSLLKLALVRDMGRVGQLASDMLGAGVVADTGAWGTFAWSEFLLGVPGYRIGGGTDEVLRNVIGERVLGLPKEPQPEHG